MNFKPKGIISALITPLDSNYKVNENSLRKLINYVLDGGIHGVFVLGTTGEFYGFTPEEKREIIQIAVDEVEGRVPVYAGTFAITTKDCVLLTNIAEECKVDAVSILTPMFISLNQCQLRNHYKTIAKNTDLPVLLYNNFPKTGITIDPTIVEELSKVENIVGIKDSSGDFGLTNEYIRVTKNENFYILAGRDNLIYSSLCCGANGAIAACANVAPEICAKIYNKYISGDMKGSLESQHKLTPLRLAFNLGTFPTIIKEALELIGIKAGPCFSPVGKMLVEEKEQLKKIIQHMDLL